MKKRLFFITFLCCLSFQLLAQLSETHYLPPVFFVREKASVQLNIFSPNESGYVYIKTRDKSLIDSVYISAKKSVIYNFDQKPQMLASLPQLNQKISNKGIICNGNFEFSVLLRVFVDGQAGACISKGSLGLGKSFRSGHLITQYAKKINKDLFSSFISVMAVKDYTQVKIENTREGVSFSGQASSSITVELMKGETYTIAQRAASFLPKKANNINGTSITSSKPIAVMSGSFLALNPIDPTRWLADGGFDQLIPQRNLGKQYIVPKGNGEDGMENLILVANQNNTSIKINDQIVYLKKEGDVKIIDGLAFNENGNAFLIGNKPFYLFQHMSGANNLASSGFSCVPPLNLCEKVKSLVLPKVHISESEKLRGTAINVISLEGTLVSVYDDASNKIIRSKSLTNVNTTPLAAGWDWVSEKIEIPPTVEDIRIEIDGGPLNMVMFNQSRYIGAATYFSGDNPTPILKIDGNGQLDMCTKGKVTFRVANPSYFSKYEWYKDDKLYKKTTAPYLEVTEQGNYKVLGVDVSCGKSLTSIAFSIKKCEELSVKDEGVYDEPVSAIESLIKDVKIGNKAFINILFDYNSPKLSVASKANLDEIVSYLKTTSHHLEIITHSDCRGSADYNLKLSQQRAESVKKYLIEKGVNQKMLTAIGKGESEPIIDCQCDGKGSINCTDEQHQLNRRSEFKVVE